MNLLHVCYLFLVSVHNESLPRTELECAFLFCMNLGFFLISKYPNIENNFKTSLFSIFSYRVIYIRKRHICCPTYWLRKISVVLLLTLHIQLFNCLREKEGQSIVQVVSPLVSLTLDQKRKFAPRDLRTEFVGESQHDASAWKSVQDGFVQLVFISLEALIGNRRWRDMLSSKVYQENLVAFVVNEAQCVKNGKF